MPSRNALPMAIVAVALLVAILAQFAPLFHAHAHDAEKRSPQWRSVRAEHLKDHPACAVCGRTDEVEVHHVIPFHVDPSRELDKNNLITLCRGSANHHLLFGHLMSFRSWNPDVKKDAAIWREKIKNRPTLKDKK